MESRIPASVQAMLAAFRGALEERLPGRVDGLYLHGSAAQGAYNPHFSDLDLIGLLNHRLADAELDILERLHHDFLAQFPRSNLEIHYFQWDDLGKDKKQIGPHPYFSDSALKRAERQYFGPLTWWILKHRSLALWGPQPADLAFEINWKPEVHEYNRRTLAGYWQPWTRRPRNLISLFHDEVSYWSVLGLCRLHYNLAQADICSKEEAGKYAQAFVPACHQRVIQEAMRIRAGEPKSYYSSRLRISRLRRAIDIVRFMNYMVPECQRVSTIK